MTCADVKMRRYEDERRIYVDAKMTRYEDEKMIYVDGKMRGIWVDIKMRE